MRARRSGRRRSQSSGFETDALVNQFWSSSGGGGEYFAVNTSTKATSLAIKDETNGNNSAGKNKVVRVKPDLEES